MPTVFAETVALDGVVGEYLTLARRKGDVCYIASMTDGYFSELAQKLFPEIRFPQRTYINEC